jgi:hypothetical protein
MSTLETLESRIASGCPQCWHPKHSGERCEGSISTSREASGFGPCPCYACVNGHLVLGAMNDDGTCDECAPTMDWEQVRLNGGPPCYWLPPGSSRYCGRAKRWVGHWDFDVEKDHEFIHDPPSAEAVHSWATSGLHDADPNSPPCTRQHWGDELPFDLIEQLHDEWHQKNPTEPYGSACKFRVTRMEIPPRRADQ